MPQRRCQDHFWTNIRIILCIICCALGCYAQFGAKFPQDSSAILVCVVGYFAVGPAPVRAAVSNAHEAGVAGVDAQRAPGPEEAVSSPWLACVRAPFLGGCVAGAPLGRERRLCAHLGVGTQWVL